MLRLYEAENSVCSQKVLITLAEKGMDHEACNLDLFRNEQYDPAYLRINPKGVVPTRVHNGMTIRESTLISEYLDGMMAMSAIDEGLGDSDRLAMKAAGARIKQRLRERRLDYLPLITLTPAGACRFAPVSAPHVS